MERCDAKGRTGERRLHPETFICRSCSRLRRTEMQDAVDNAFLSKTKDLHLFDDVRCVRRLMTSSILEEMSCHTITGSIYQFLWTNDLKKPQKDKCLRLVSC